MYNKVNIKIKYSHTHAHTYKQLVKNFYFRIEKSNRNPTSKLENSSPPTPEKPHLPLKLLVNQSLEMIRRLGIKIPDKLDNLMAEVASYE